MSSIAVQDQDNCHRLISVPIDEKRITKLNSGPCEVIYQNVINYPRSNLKGVRTCVMCGKMDGKDCVIPGQNKDVCKVCDSLVWLSASQDVEFKFCKGCKNFACIYEFYDKPKATKCVKCRDRCRSSYTARRSVNNLVDSTESDFARYLSNSPRGVADVMIPIDSDGYGPKKNERPRGTSYHAGICLPSSSNTHGRDMATYYNYDRDKDIAAYMSPAMYNSSMVSPIMGKENAENASSIQRPPVNGFVGDFSGLTDSDSKTPRFSGLSRGLETPGFLLPRAHNSLLNIRSKSNRQDVETPMASECVAGKNVLDDLLLLNASIRKSPLTFISATPSSDIPQYCGFGNEDFSPSQRHRMLIEQRMVAHTPQQPSTPVDLVKRPSSVPTPTSNRSWDSQEGGAWYHDVLIAMSKDQSVMKAVAMQRTRSLDEYEAPVAKRIRYCDAPSPAAAKTSPKGDLTPPSTPVESASQTKPDGGAKSCPIINSIFVRNNGGDIARPASCSKLTTGPVKKSQIKWEWDPNANPLMHLAMVLSKNESDEEEIFRDLSSDSSSSADESDSNISVHSLIGSHNEERHSDQPI